MGNKMVRRRKVAKGTSAARVSDLRQLRKLGLLPPESSAIGTPLHPPIDGLVWTDHARQRFAERVAPDLEPELLYDFLKGRQLDLIPYHVELMKLERHGRCSPYCIYVRDVCRVILDWKPHNPDAPDWATRGIWVVVTILPC